MYGSRFYAGWPYSRMVSEGRSFSNIYRLVKEDGKRSRLGSLHMVDPDDLFHR